MTRIRVKRQVEIEIEVLLALNDFLQTQQRPVPILDGKMMAFLDNLKFLAINQPEVPCQRHGVYPQMEQAFIKLKNYYASQNPQPRSAVAELLGYTDPMVIADFLASDFCVKLAKFVLARIDESQNTNFIKFLLNYDAITNPIKANIILAQNLEKQKSLLSWILSDNLEYYLTSVITMPINSNTPQSTLFLTDLFIWLKDKPELIDLAIAAAQIIAIYGSPTDQALFLKYYPTITLPNPHLVPSIASNLKLKN